MGLTVSFVPTSLYCTTWSRLGASVGSERLTCTNGRWLPTRNRASVLFDAISTGRETMRTFPRDSASVRIASIRPLPSSMNRTITSPSPAPSVWASAVAPPPRLCGARSMSAPSENDLSRRASTISTSISTCSGLMSSWSTACCNTA